MSTLVSIILLAHSDIKKTKHTIKQIAKSSHGTTFEIIVIDFKKRVKPIQYNQNITIKVIDFPEDHTLSQAYNSAVEQSSGQYIAYLENDVTPHNNWLEGLIDTLESSNEIAVAGPKIKINQKTNIWQKIGNRKKSDTSLIKLNLIATNGMFSIDYDIHKGYIDTSETNKKAIALAKCFLVSKSHFQQVVGFSNEYKFEWTLIDFFLKLHQLGLTHYCHLLSDVTYTLDETHPLDKTYLPTDLNFHKKWYKYLQKIYWNQKMQPMHSSFVCSKTVIAIAVTDHGENVSAGDFYTASELAVSLKSIGFDVIFLSRYKKQWYDVPSKVDILINLLDEYDLSQIQKRTKKLITIAWARNWFDKWCESTCFNQYDMVFASSQKACHYINANSNKTAQLLPIATNPERFQQPHLHDCQIYKSDLCFTGSYWGFPRDIMEFMHNGDADQYNFHLYGANWEHFGEFELYNKGFVVYQKLPCVYHNTKIVIDDANHVTKPYGSVNSRVYDALISDTLVITNGVLGSQELFSGQLPYYESSEQLTELIDYYLNNETKRQEKVSELKSLIINHHTYLHRANFIHETLRNTLKKKSIAIKIPAPSWQEAHNWGDFHMAALLKKQLMKLNYRVILQVLPEWDNLNGNACDIVIVFRGLSQYTVKPHQINLMWNISHPDKVSLVEYESYDKVFIASNYWSNKIAQQISTPVETLLQCTDPERFYPPTPEQKNEHHCQLLYIGNSREIYRKAIKELLPTSYDLHVYGNDWDEFIDQQFIKGEHIENNILYRYYGSCDILLNDHWQDMCEKGFISNRIFDALACGALVLTDEVTGFDDFVQYVEVYRNSQELKNKIDFHFSNPDQKSKKTQGSINFIKESHTYYHRALALSKSINILINKEK